MERRTICSVNSRQAVVSMFRKASLAYNAQDVFSEMKKTPLQHRHNYSFNTVTKQQQET